MASKAIKFVIKVYTDDNTLWVKHATHLKAEPLRTAHLLKLDIRSIRTLSSIQRMINLKKKFFF